MPVVAAFACPQAIRLLPWAAELHGRNSDAGGTRAGQDQSKEASLAASRTLNPHPEGVTHPAFTSGAFFDPANLVQVKYEMVRAVEAGGLGAGAAAAAFGLARQTYYNARKALADHGLAGLIPARPGPQGGHKLTAEVVDFLEQQLSPIPRRPQRRWPQRSRTSSASASTNDRSSARSPPGAPPGTSSRRRPKAASTSPQGRTRARLRSPALMSSCAVSPPAGSAAAGDTGQRY